MLLALESSVGLVFFECNDLQYYFSINNSTVPANNTLVVRSARSVKIVICFVFLVWRENVVDFFSFAAYIELSTKKSAFINVLTSFADCYLFFSAEEPARPLCE